jgi:PPOX class probable FMN-dependent enzyme
MLLSKVLETEADLRTVYKRPSSGSVAKSLAKLDSHAQRFIELSPFLCIGTTGPDGLGDVTPRGGEAGFVHVLEPTCLAMPDRPGNNRLDTLGNIVRSPGIGLLFFVPGFEDTLRVNGTARITTDESLLQRFIFNGKLPLTVIVIDVKEVYFHCAKALRRSALWSVQAQVPRSSFPSMGQVLRDQLELDTQVAEIDRFLDAGVRDTLY